MTFFKKYQKCIYKPEICLLYTNTSLGKKGSILFLAEENRMKNLHLSIIYLVF